MAARPLELEADERRLREEKALNREIRTRATEARSREIDTALDQISTQLRETIHEVTVNALAAIDAWPILEKNAQLIQGHPGGKIQIEGHCDGRGTVEYNLPLGDRRARSTRDYLISLGVDPGQLSTISFGEERPLDPDHNEEAWAKNRREFLGGIMRAIAVFPQERAVRRQQRSNPTPLDT